MNDIFLKFGGDLILVRHGENIIDTTISNDLLSLTEKGKKQAQEVKGILNNHFDIVMCSTAIRCIMTSEIIMNGKEPIKDIRLLEKGWGNKEHDGRESNEQAKERFIGVLKDIAKRYQEKRVVIVTHGSFIKLAQDVLENRYIERNRVNNCNVIEYNRNGKKIILKS